MTSRAHRSVPVAPRRGWVEVDGQLVSLCRWCERPIYKADGTTPDLRRTWHGPCADAYLIRRNPRHLRKVTFDRDHGVCADCGRECAVEATKLEATVRVARKLYTRHGYLRDAERRYWREVWPWNPDHRVPLVDGGSFDMDNVDTRCERCHAAKTARENRARAHAKKVSAAREAGQLEFEEGA